MSGLRLPTIAANGSSCTRGSRERLSPATLPASPMSLLPAERVCPPGISGVRIPDFAPRRTVHMKGARDHVFVGGSVLGRPGRGRQYPADEIRLAGRAGLFEQVAEMPTHGAY